MYILGGLEEEMALWFDLVLWYEWILFSLFLMLHGGDKITVDFVLDDMCAGCEGWIQFKKILWHLLQGAKDE